MKKKKLASLIALILAAALGLVFVVSAYAKTMPISYFEYVVDSQLGLGTTWSAIAARLLIGLEAAIGLLLIFQLWGRNYWVLKMGLLLLVLFSLHLIVLWATVGNNVNCGCMGNQIYLSPVQSLLKNTVLIIGFLTVWILIRVSTKNELEPKKNPKDSNPQNNNYHWITILVSILLMGIPFFVFPITNKLALPVSKLASAEGIHPSGTYSGKGKQIIALMSLGCSHCRDAAEKFAVIKKNQPGIPIHLFFSKGSDSTYADKLEDFMQETNARELPYSFIPKEDFIYFMQATKNDGVPIILWMQDSTVYRQVMVYEINEQEIVEWMY